MCPCPASVLAFENLVVVRKGVGAVPLLPDNDGVPIVVHRHLFVERARSVRADVVGCARRMRPAPTGNGDVRHVGAGDHTAVVRHRAQSVGGLGCHRYGVGSAV